MAKRLLTAVDCEKETHLIVGSTSNIAFQRALKSIDSGADPILIHNGEISLGIKDLFDENKLQWIQKEFDLEDLVHYGREDVDFIVDKVFVVESNIKNEIFLKCKRLRIPINTYQCSSLSTFTILSTYTKGDLQIGVTTSGKGCNLSSRIKREVVKTLPSNIEDTIENIGELKKNITQDDFSEDLDYENEMISESQTIYEDKSLRRARWLTQMIEYYPLAKLSSLSIQDFTEHYKSYKSTNIVSPSKGSISLVGSGPGSLSCLTLGALNEIKTADLILIDKLVPQEIIDTIPRTTEIFIAKKFPGNASKAQEELINRAMDGVLKGLKVVRLKQGDPYIYGRGGEEYKYFHERGIQEIKVLPGLTSALTAPLFADIPMTHRGISDKVLICTGTGSQGSLPVVPDYDPQRTTIFLMAVHRLEELTLEMIKRGWDQEISVAIIERGSCLDQRVIRSKLKYISTAMNQLGSRPPGLLVVGWSCGVLKQPLDQKSKWIVTEGVGNNVKQDVMDMIRKLY